MSKKRSSSPSPAPKRRTSSSSLIKENEMVTYGN
jgi:hypothetical protein